MGTLDNIYAINYLINKQLGRKGVKLVALSIDLKTAYDSIDREMLMGTMRQRRVREGLAKRVEQVLRETKSRATVGGKVGDCFWTAREVRQGCSLSPLLFNILLADLEEQMGRVKWGE